MVGQRIKQQENVSFRLKNIMPGAKKLQEEHCLGVFLHLA
jgi:hypothetical protein